MKFNLLVGLCLPLSASAQTAEPLSAIDNAGNRCEVVIPPGYDTPSQQPFSIHPLGEPSRFPLPETNKQIFDNGYEYVYRLALCVSPEYVNGTYGGDLTKVRQWVREIGEYLNMVYQRDLGIRFIVIEDDKLLLTDSPNYPIEDSYGTKIINEKIGTEAYDCGILIRPTHNGLSGRTLLGGVYQSYNKGNAMANSDMGTIAHELGHLFGAKHTHQKNDALCTEPGYGQSIMSYGEPRNAFALSSVLAIRSRLKSQCYYTSSDRNPNEIEGGIPEPDANIPYVVKSTYTKPVLDRRQLRSNYTIPEGTNFQFYIPTSNTSATFTYGAQTYDPGVYGYQTNALQPTYNLGKHPCVMFQPYYDEGHNNEGKTDAVLVPYSDAFRAGRYQFLLAAADHGRYDIEPVYLHIVKGKPFKMKTDIKMDQFQGKPLSLSWEPCQELYGTDSKVRILLSDDFGQTYKYVLDDNVPNTGSWNGYWPYVTIEKTGYRNFSQPIRGGVIKIEVKDEAAYCVSKELPAYLNPNITYVGGFLLGDRSTYVRFKDGPQPYLEVSDESQVPALSDLQAYHKNDTGKTVWAKGEETRDGHVIRRRWTASINGTSSTYTQLIVIQDESLLERKGLENRADELRPQALDLYRNKGAMGYPKTDLPEMQAFLKAYQAVFDTEGKVQPDATDEKLQQLGQSLIELAAIGDDQVVRPASKGYYRLRNYQDLYGRATYYYLKQGTDAQTPDIFTPQAEEATLWRCTESEGKFTFVAEDGRKLYIEQLINPGYRETLRLDRGYTWGAFTLVDETGACGQLSQNGNWVTRNENYASDPQGYRTNRNSLVSTDFQWLSVPAVEASTSAGKGVWNILTDPQRLTLNDAYTHLHVGNSVSVKQLQLTRTFADTEWQPLYLPFTTKVQEWMKHCEVAQIDGLAWQGNHATGTPAQTVLEWVKVTEGTLRANHPYLIRAKQAGTFTFDFSPTTVEPTLASRIDLSQPQVKASLNGNYEVLTGEQLANQGGYTLQAGQLVRCSSQGASLSSMRWFLALTSQGSSTLPQVIRLVEKGQAAIGNLSIRTNEGYATLFHPTAYVMPQGVTGYAVTQADAAHGTLTLTPAYRAGETVPAATPLLVKGARRDYLLFAPTGDQPIGPNPPADNLLLGSNEEGLTEAPEGGDTSSYRFYKLYYSTIDTGIPTLGFYWGSPDGGPFTNQAGKAYLALPADVAAQVKGFSLTNDPQTGCILPTQSSEGTPVVYTLTGIRLYPTAQRPLSPGVYIINGQKVLIK